MPKLLPLSGAQPLTTSAVVVLVDLVGSTRLAHALPLAHYMALMSEFVQVMVLSFEASGGHVLQHQGDAVLGYWAAARCADASETAVECHDRANRLGLARHLGLRLQVRAGLACGEVLTGMVGGQPSAYGLPLNFARRLCDAAAPGETLACRRVADGAGPGVRADLRGPLYLHGFDDACEVYRLGQPAQQHMKVD